jgi:hypothetical protein
VSSGLPNVLYVADDAVIDGVAFNIQSTIVVPARVAVPIKGFADDRAGQVGVTSENHVRARSVEGGGKISRRGDVDELRRVRIARADRVVLKISGDAAGVVDVACFDVDVAVDKNLHVHIGFDGDVSGQVTGDMDGNVGLGSADRVDDEISTEG